jgi:hypothetical protein
MQWLGYFICKGQVAFYAKATEDTLPKGQVLFTQWYSSYLRKGKKLPKKISWHFLTGRRINIGHTICFHDMPYQS